MIVLVLCVSSLDIQLRAFWRTFLHKHHFRKGRVLLTGATGFLGAFLLKEMLLNSKVRVTPALMAPPVRRVCFLSGKVKKKSGKKSETC